MRMVPTSLTGRLVATVVTLAIVTSVLLGVMTTLVMRKVLNGQLDTDIQRPLSHSLREGRSLPGPGPGAPDGDEHGNGPARDRELGGAEGTLSVECNGDECQGIVVTRDLIRRPLSPRALDIVTAFPADDDSHVIDLSAFGSFRVRAMPLAGSELFAGHSTREVDEAVSKLVLAEILLGLGAVGVAVGAGRLL